jgi:hypothetical protein
MVDLMCLRQSYERREITEIKWIDGNSNPADAHDDIQTMPGTERLNRYEYSQIGGHRVGRENRR